MWFHRRGKGSGPSARLLVLHMPPQCPILVLLCRPKKQVRQYRISTGELPGKGAKGLILTCCSSSVALSWCLCFDVSVTIWCCIIEKKDFVGPMSAHKTRSAHVFVWLNCHRTQIEVTVWHLIAHEEPAFLFWLFAPFDKTKYDWMGHIMGGWRIIGYHKKCSTSANMCLRMTATFNH